MKKKRNLFRALRCRWGGAVTACALLVCLLSGTQAKAGLTPVSYNPAPSAPSQTAVFPALLWGAQLAAAALTGSYVLGRWYGYQTERERDRKGSLYPGASYPINGSFLLD